MLTSVEVSRNLRNSDWLKASAQNSLERMLSMASGLQAFSSLNPHRCFCGPNVKPGRRASPRSRLRMVTRAEESQTSTESERAQQSQSGGPSSNGADSSDKKKGPRLSFAPNTRSVQSMA